MSTNVDSGGSKGWSFEEVVLLAVLALLPVTMASGFTSYEAIKGCVLLMGGGLLGAAFGVRVARGQALSVRGWLLLVPLLGLGILGAVSALWASNEWAALKDACHWFVLAALILEALSPRARAIALERVIVAISVGVGLAAIVGLLQALGFPLDTEGPSSLADGLRGSFDHERYAAITLCCVLPLMASGMWLGGKVSRAIVGVCAAAAALYVGACNVPLAWAFGGVGAGLALAVLLIARRGQALEALKRPLLSLLAVAALVAVGALTLDIAPETEMAQANGKLVKARGHSLDPLEEGNIRQAIAVGAVDWGRPVPPATWEGHKYALSTGVRASTARPVVGVGAGNWDHSQTLHIDRGSEFYRKSQSDYPTFRMAHSSFVQLAAELGFLGLLLFLLAFAVGVAAVSKAFKHQGGQADERWLLGVFGLMATVCALTAAAALSSVLELATSSAYFAVALGLMTREGLVRLEERGVAGSWEVDAGSKLEKWSLAIVPAVVISILAIGVGLGGTLSDFYKARGDVWLRAGNLDEADVAYRQALTVMPGNDLALLNLSNLSEVISTQAETERLTLECLELRPNDPRVFAALGQIQMREAARRGRKEWAEKNGPGAGGKPAPKELDPKELDPAKMDPSKLFEFVDKELMKSAVANFARAKELHPRYMLAYERLSNAYMVEKNIEKAQLELLRGLDQLTEADGQVAGRLHYSLSQSYLAEQAWLKAEKHLIKALESDPQHTRADSIMRDLGQIDARKKGKKVKAHGHEHGPSKPGGLSPVPVKPSLDKEKGHEEKGHEEKGHEEKGHPEAPPKGDKAP